MDRPATEFPTSGGVCGDLIRTIDWSASPLGPLAGWPASLRTSIQSMLESRHPMFLWWGPELIQFYNDAYVPSFGVGRHPAAMGQRGADCWRDIWPIIEPQIRGVMQRGEPTWHEDALVPIFRNGRIEEVYWTYGYSPVRDESGRICGTLVVCTETTERVIAVRHHRLLRAMAENVAQLDRPRAVLEKVLASCRTDGHDLPFAAWFPPDPGEPSIVEGLDAASATAAELARACSTRAAAGAVVMLAEPVAAGPWPEPVTSAYVVCGLRGVFAFGLSPRLPFDARYRDFLLQVVASASVLYERSEAAATRAATESERRDLLMQAPVAMALLTGPDHVYQLANQHYVQMVGREVVGRKYLEVFPEVAGTELARIVDDVYWRGEAFAVDEMVVPLDVPGSGQRRDRYFRFSLHPIRTAAGQVYGMMAVAHDITDTVLARKEREQLVAQLESANRAKDEFLALLGHELRNPIAPLVTALELIAERGDEYRTAEHRIMERQVTHLGRLVDDLLDVARISRGKIELQREDAIVQNVIRSAIDMASPMVEKRQQALDVSWPDEPIHWWGDPVRLAQVVANLLTNAARYSEAQSRILVFVEADAASVTICVADNGYGIAPELLPTVFQSFVQGGVRALDRAEGGLGIGLTLVKSLVELHGGSVKAESPGVGQGSRFTVTLPRGQAKASPPQPAPVKTGGGGSPKRVLIVDDNEDAATMLAELLRRHGHEVAVAHDAAAALKVVPGFTPEVALLDIGLPVIDGYELAQRLRNLPSAATCRLIAVTGYGQDGDRERAMEAGFARHLVKPVFVEELLQAIAG